MTEAGGFHDGIIIKKVMRKGEGTQLVLIGGVECTLHNKKKDVYGMGEFVKSWFEEKTPGYRGDILRAYKDVWLSLKDIFKARLLQQNPEKHRQSAREGGKMVSALEQVIETIDSYYGIRRAVHDSPKSQSSSGSDDSAEKGARLDSIDRSVKEVFQQMHDIKVFYKEISKDHAEKVMDKKDVFKLLEAHGFYELEHGLQKTALREIQEEIKKLDPSKALTKEVAEPIIKSGIKKYFFATAQRQVEEAQRQAKEAQHQAELEKQARLEKQQRVEELEKQLEEQRKIAEELKREAQARKEGEEARKSSSSQSQFDTFKESREENANKIKRAKMEDPDARRSPSPFDEKK